MFRTGNSFIDSFSEILAFAPLLPVFVILFRRIFHEDIFNYLTTVCLLDFIRRLTIRISQPNLTKLIPLIHVFSLMEFIFLVLAFRTILRKGSREMVNVLAIALISAVITHDIIKGIGQNSYWLDLLQHAFIVILAGYCLVRSVKKENLQILYSALFWISTGTLFYFSTILLVEMLSGCFASWRSSSFRDSELLLDFASLARYFFYLLAALLYKSRENSLE
ncbi:MAG: hypothetical protein C5B59_10430 [Bacteroidetes bacterium]|nr:MAG: hypothetical protein C5B59_10430 [Bacteroidota bacterium]